MKKVKKRLIKAIKANQKKGSVKKALSQVTDEFDHFYRSLFINSSASNITENEKYSRKIGRMLPIILFIFLICIMAYFLLG